MPGAVRLLFQPLIHRIPQGLAVVGGTLGLVRLGKTVVVEPSGNLPARINFFARSMKTARPTDNPSFQAFATLSGTLYHDAGVPKFALTADAIIEYTEATVGTASSPSRLRLAFEAKYFTGLPVVADSVLSYLRLPAIPSEARFLEVAVELEVDGSIEASLDQNDRLDVPLRNISYFEIDLADLDEAPVSDHGFELLLADGSTVSGRTDEHGIIRFDPIPSGQCFFRSL